MPRTSFRFLFPLATIVSLAFASFVQRNTPRKLDDGRYLLSNGWSLTPAGREVALGGLPLKITPHPDGRHLFVMSSGYTKPFVAVIDAETETVKQRVQLNDGWLGVAVSSNGKWVYASAASEDRVLVYSFNGQLTLAGDIKLEPITFPAGLTMSSQGERLIVVGNASHQLIIVDTVTRKATSSIAVGVKPYACALSTDEKTAYVSNWGEDSVSIVDLVAGRTQRLVKVQDHPNDLLLTADGRLFVANGSRNTVSVIDTRTLDVVEQIDAALVPNSPPGSTPNALALSADGKTLFVCNADNNAIAVIDISNRERSVPRGFIPTGWYPTAACLVGKSNGSVGKIVVANGKGSVTKPNAAAFKYTGANPGYIAGLLDGSLSFVDLPNADALARYSQQAYRNSPYAMKAAASVRPPFPLGKDCPIQHVVYLIKENRTYDQIFGDVNAGNGAAEYCLFDEKVTPNHHALARQFVLFDNFYHDAEVSADGHHWVNSAYANDYVEKLWPGMYAQRGQRHRVSLHDDPGPAYASHGFMWDLCAKAGVTYRSYGEFVRLRNAEPGKARAAIPSLVGHCNEDYLGSDAIANMSDSQRLAIWLKDFREFEKRGEMPRYQVLSLPGDHTMGTRPGIQTPRAMVAENDLALGKIVEAIAASRFWKSTAIFVVEDDAQNGPDHVDCHRTVALVISPYLRRGIVDSTMYSTSSMLHTMERILGLPPMTQYDAGAAPMWAAFQPRPDLRPYQAQPARIRIDEKNTLLSYGAKRSQELSLDEADEAPEDEFSEIIWKSVKGKDSLLPPRRVGAFVRSL